MDKNPSEYCDPCCSGRTDDGTPQQLPPAPRGSGGVGSTQAKLDANWRKQMPAFQQQLIQYSQLQQQRRHQRRDTAIQVLQGEVDESWKLHPCCHRCRGHYDSTSLSPVAGERPTITYRHLTCYGTLSLSSWACSKCGITFQPTAIQLECFPASPVVQYVWFDQDMLLAYSSLATPYGLSGTGATLVRRHTSLGLPTVNKHRVCCLGCQSAPQRQPHC